MNIKQFFVGRTIGFLVVVILIGAFYLFNNNENKVSALPQDYKDAEYIINGKSVKLSGGISEVEAVPESVSKITTKYFGNEIKKDLNNDGREDLIFLLTQNSGGSGTFFYVVAAINTKDGYVGSRGFLLGDRIAPQTTEISRIPSHENVIVVNYMDRATGEPFTTQPSVGKSIWLKLDTETMQFGEVEQNFEGEADPNIMTLDMQTWTWIKTLYSNDTELVPNDSKAFTITFRNDSTFSVTTDCNLMSGSYEINNNKITFEETIAMTRKFCGGSQEQEFASLLTEIHSYFFTSRGELIFDLKFDSGSAIFR